MISTSEEEVLDKCLSDCPTGADIESYFFRKRDITNKPSISGFNFNRFKRFLSKKSKVFCSRCDEPFDGTHEETYRTKKTVYVFDIEKVSSEVVDTAETRGPLEEVKEESTDSGVYRIEAKFGDRTLHFEFFADQREFLDSNLDPFDLQFPVLLRDFSASKQREYRFSWRELISESFRGKISELVTKIKNKTTAVFAEYDEPFVSDHRTEIKKSVRDYFSRSGYKVHTEVADWCPEIELYGIDASEADYVCIKENEKILVTHGEDRDGWYIQRFVDGKLVSIENEDIFQDFHDQIDDKIRRYKRIDNHLGSAPMIMRGLGGVVAVVTTIVAMLSIDEINSYIQSLSSVSAYSTEVVLLIVLLNTAISITFVAMLVTPYVRMKLFSWKMYSCGQPRPCFDILQHTRFRLK